MKTLALIALFLSLAVLGVALYVHFSITPAVDRAEFDMEMANTLMIGDANFATDTWYILQSEKVNYGSIALLGSTLPLLLGLFAAVKKVKMGWIAVAISLAAFFLGALHATHMFS